MPAGCRGDCHAPFNTLSWRAQGLGDPGALGSALLRVVLERHGGLPASAEAGLLLAAAAAYEVGCPSLRCEP